MLRRVNQLIVVAIALVASAVFTVGTATAITLPPPTLCPPGQTPAHSLDSGMYSSNLIFQTGVAQSPYQIFRYNVTYFLPDSGIPFQASGNNGYEVTKISQAYGGATIVIRVCGDSTPLLRSAQDISRTFCLAPVTMQRAELTKTVPVTVRVYQPLVKMEGIDEHPTNLATLTVRGLGCRY